MDPVVLECAAAVFGWDRALLAGNDAEWFATPDPWWAAHLGDAAFSPAKAVAALEAVFERHLFDVVRVRKKAGVPPPTITTTTTTTTTAAPAPPAASLPVIVAFTGLRGAGKDTASHLLCGRKNGFRRASFATPLKDCVALLFGWNRELLEGHLLVSRRWREVEDARWTEALRHVRHPFFYADGRVSVTPRKVLQFMGTDVMRAHLHPDVWTLSLRRRVLRGEYGSKVVVTDARFRNEIEALHQMGGRVLRVRRGAVPEWARLAREDPEKMAERHPHVHASEWASMGLEDAVVENHTDSLRDLAAGVFAALEA